MAGFAERAWFVMMGRTAHLLVGSLAHSGTWRAVLWPSTDQPHLVGALDGLTAGSAATAGRGGSTG